MTFELHRHDARNISTLLEPDSVDLIVTSPPYFALRSYRDTCQTCDGTGVAPAGATGTPGPVMLGPSSKSTLGGSKANRSGSAAAGGCPTCGGSGGEHYDGQLGSESTPAEFVDALIACTADWLRVLKPGGSLFVNLGDKYAGSGGHNNNGLGKSTLVGTPSIRDRSASLPASRRNAPDRYNQASDGIPDKSRMGLPWRYAIRCVDELGLILRADIIWSKPNGLPESVTDRVRISHEYLFHFTRQGRYFAAIDEVREAHSEPLTASQMRAKVGSPKSGVTHNGTKPSANDGDFGVERMLDVTGSNPLGKVPGSVWSIPSEPLTVPAELGVDHFAAYPSELVRRIVLGWSPTGWCTACGEARRAVVDKQYLSVGDTFSGGTPTAGRHTSGVRMGDGIEATITGYECACWNPTLAPFDDAPPTTPAVVCDPFAGTGTTCAVAHHLGRHGIGTDLSRDYLRLAEWRCASDTRLRDKVLERSDLPAAPKIDGQLDLFGGAA